MTLAMFFFYLYAGFSICWFNYEDGFFFQLMDRPGDCCSAGVRSCSNQPTLQMHLLYINAEDNG